MSMADCNLQKYSYISNCSTPAIERFHCGHGPHCFGILCKHVRRSYACSLNSKLLPTNGTKDRFEGQDYKTEQIPAYSYHQPSAMLHSASYNPYKHTTSKEPFATICSPTLAHHQPIVYNTLSVPIIIRQFRVCWNLSTCKQCYTIQKGIAAVCEHWLYHQVAITAMIDEPCHIACRQAQGTYCCK